MGKASQKKRKAEEREQLRCELADDPVLNADELRWHVWTDGYEWRGKGKNRALYPISDGSISVVFGETKPAKVSDLFERFATLEATESAFTAFANKYGRLGVAIPMFGRLAHSCEVGESF